MEITKLDVLLGNSLEWTKEGTDDGWKNATRFDGHVQGRCPGEDGANSSSGGVRSKLGAVNHVDIGYIRVGSINRSAFGGIKRCDYGSM
jgi:hypothetical protein